jgi:hypothetical protein
MYPERKKSTVELDWVTEDIYGLVGLFLLPSVQAGVTLTTESRVYNN